MANTTIRHDATEDIFCVYRKDEYLGHFKWNRNIAKFVVWNAAGKLGTADASFLAVDMIEAAARAR